MSQANQAAGDRNVLVHGAVTAQLALAAGVLDELEIHLIPVLLGQGRHLFDHLDPEQIELERTRVLEGDGVTHSTTASGGKSPRLLGRGRASPRAASRPGLQQRPRDRAVRLDDRAELNGVIEWQLSSVRATTGPSRALVDQRHLAEPVARSEPANLGAIPRDRGLAGLDDEERRCRRGPRRRSHDRARRFAR